MSLDLHIHSTYSDGTQRPAEIVKMAKAKGLRAIAITDHDTTEGVQEALDAGSETGLEVITGIELSAVQGGRHVHLLGYCFDHNDSALIARVRHIQNARNLRNESIIKKLQSLGISIGLDEVIGKSSVGQTGRPHIAQVLLEKNIVRSIDDAFGRFLKKGAVAYVPREVLTAEEAIRIIREAGGVPVLAHPVTIDNSLRSIPEILTQLVALGLGGIEVYYPSHSTKNQKQLTTFAQRYGLAVSGGSDYHGDIRPGTMLAGGKNVYVPYEILSQLKSKRITNL